MADLPAARVVAHGLVAVRAELSEQVAAATAWVRVRALALAMTAVGTAVLLSFHAWLVASVRVH